MKSAIVAALVGSAVAASHNAHAGFHLRRGDYAADCGTVTTTVYVTAGLPTIVPNTTVVVPPAPVPQTTTSCTEEETSTPAPPPPPPSYSAAVPSAPAPKPSAPSTGSGSSSGPWHKPNGNKWAITYTPYTTSGDCKSQSEVASDIANIASLGYAAIRVYSTDCGVFSNVVPATKSHNLNVIYGIFLDAATPPFSSGADAQLQEIIAGAPKDTMSMLIVGNEYVSGHGGDPAQLASYVAEVKSQFRAAGFTAPVTTAETVAAWEQHGSAWCGAVDIFAAQVQPFFDGSKTASQAGSFAASQLAQAAAVCPEAAAAGKFISEIGWPASGEANGVAIPSPSEQKIALGSIVESVGDHACIFSYQSDAWKAAGQWKVEQSFGAAEVLAVLGL